MGAIGAVFSNLALIWGKWLADRIVALIVRQVGNKERLEILCEAIDNKVDFEEKNMPESGKATREVLLQFADVLKLNLTEAD
jgi:hypothetical protein